MKRAFRVIVVCVFVCGIIMSQIVSAGAYSRYTIAKTAQQNSGGTPYMSAWKTKLTDHYVYVKNNSSSGGSLSCWVHRTNNSSSTSNNTVDRYYGKWTYNGASMHAVTVSKGKSKNLTNYVHEDGYTYAALGYIMNRENVAYSITWGPDL